MPGSKVINHEVLAHEWLYDLMTRPDMRIKVGHMSHDIRILGRIVGVRSTKQSVWHLLTPTSCFFEVGSEQLYIVKLKFWISKYIDKYRNKLYTLKVKIKDKSTGFERCISYVERYHQCIG